MNYHHTYDMALVCGIGYNDAYECEELNHFI